MEKRTSLGLSDRERGYPDRRLWRLRVDFPAFAGDATVASSPQIFLPRPRPEALTALGLDRFQVFRQLVNGVPLITTPVRVAKMSRTLVDRDGGVGEDRYTGNRFGTVLRFERSTGSPVSGPDEDRVSE